MQLDATDLSTRITLFALPSLRFFFKSFCADVNMELFEEFSDDLALLPLVDGKIVGRVEKLPLD